VTPGWSTSVMLAPAVSQCRWNSAVAAIPAASAVSRQAIGSGGEAG
jgi:hypothetical protein